MEDQVRKSWSAVRISRLCAAAPSGRLGTVSSMTRERATRALPSFLAIAAPASAPSPRRSCSAGRRTSDGGYHHPPAQAGTLLKAISATFKNGRAPPCRPTSSTRSWTKLAEQHRAQWNAFVKKIGEAGLTDTLARSSRVSGLRRNAPAELARARREIAQKWNTQKGWIAP